MSTTTGWLDAVRQVVTAVRASDVTQLELSNGDFLVRVRRAPPAAEPMDTDSQKSDESGLLKVVAPFTGVFYRSPTPSARSYVSEGDWVTAETVVGLVETMKIFNEVTADVSGRVVGFRADSGQLVHVGDTLVLIEPGERTPAESEPHV